MHTASAAAMKGYYKITNSREIPREGTKIRELYDLFIGRKGQVVRVAQAGRRQTAIRRLQDSYGLDVRPLGKGRWMLVGEWCGKVYLDYTPEAIAENHLTDA